MAKPCRGNKQEAEVRGVYGTGGHCWSETRPAKPATCVPNKPEPKSRNLQPKRSRDSAAPKAGAISCPLAASEWHWVEVSCQFGSTDIYEASTAYQTLA